MKQQNHRLFIAAIIGVFICFFMPFVEGETGYRVLLEVANIFVNEIWTMDSQHYPIIFLFLAMYLWLPMMVYAYYRYVQKKRRYNVQQRSINYFLFLVGSSVYILPIYAYIDGEKVIATFKTGYWGLMVMMGIMFYCYLKIQKEQLIIDDDYKHLVD